MWCFYKKLQSIYYFFYVKLVSILLSDANSSINNITKYNSYQSFDVQSAFIYVPVRLFMVKKKLL